MQEIIFGELIGVFHLFQWDAAKKRKKNNTKNVQWLLFITKRPNGILTGHYYELKNSEGIIVSKSSIDDSYFFNSTFTYQSKPILGIALDNEIDITDNPFEPLTELIEHLSEINVNSINSQHFIEYGAIEVEPDIEI